MPQKLENYLLIYLYKLSVGLIAPWNLGYTRRSADMVNKHHATTLSFSTHNFDTGF